MHGHSSRWLVSSGDSVLLTFQGTSAVLQRHSCSVPDQAHDGCDWYACAFSFVVCDWVVRGRQEVETVQVAAVLGHVCCMDDAPLLAAWHALLKGG